MTRFNYPLDNVRVAAPCTADWEQMIGNERARFCGQCNLNVYNLSSMTRSEAESFIAKNEGRLCVRYYRRADGSVITENCPVGLRAIRRKMSYLARAMISAVLSFLAGVASFEILIERSLLEFPRREAITGELVLDPKRFRMPAPTVSEEPRVIMGDIGPVRVAPDPNRPRAAKVRRMHGD
jgi:hypothetical protein